MKILVKAKPNAKVESVERVEQPTLGLEDSRSTMVERRGNPKDGDIVIAEVDGGWTMKYLQHQTKKSPTECWAELKNNHQLENALVISLTFWKFFQLF